MARKKKTETVQSDTNEQKQATPAPAPKKHGYVFYSVHSRSMVRNGFISEYLDVDKACETVDYFYNEHRRNIAYGKWKPRQFDVYILKRDTTISDVHCEHYDYIPGSLSEARREAKLRERYGDDYREDDDIDNFDSSKYM